MRLSNASAEPTIPSMKKEASVGLCLVRAHGARMIEVGPIASPASAALTPPPVLYAIPQYKRGLSKKAHELAAIGSMAQPDTQVVWLTDLPDNVNRAVTADLVGPL